MASEERPGCGLAPIAAIFALLMAGAASGEALLLAGGAGAGEGASYAYTGALVPLRGDLGDGLLSEIFLHRVTYRYDSGAGGVDASQVGAAASLGWRKSFGSGGWGAIFGGAGYEASPDTRPRQSGGGGGIWFGRIGAEAGHEGGPWRFHGRMNAIPAMHGYWARAELLRDTAVVAVGPELVLHGNRDYRAAQAGLAFGNIRGPAETRMAFSLGRQRTDVGTGWYAGLGIVGRMR